MLPFSYFIRCTDVLMVTLLVQTDSAVHYEKLEHSNTVGCAVVSPVEVCDKLGLSPAMSLVVQNLRGV